MSEVAPNDALGPALDSDLSAIDGSLVDLGETISGVCSGIAADGAEDQAEIHARLDDLEAQLAEQAAGQTRLASEQAEILRMVRAMYWFGPRFR